MLKIHEKLDAAATNSILLIPVNCDNEDKQENEGIASFKSNYNQCISILLATNNDPVLSATSHYIWNYILELIHILNKRIPKTLLQHYKYFRDVELELLKSLIPVTTFKEMSKDEGNLASQVLQYVDKNCILEDGEGIKYSNLVKSLQKLSEQVQSFPSLPTSLDEKIFKIFNNIPWTIDNTRTNTSRRPVTNDLIDWIKAEDSLTRIINCCISVIKSSKDGHMQSFVVQRALQITGEYLKTSNSSLPEELVNLLKTNRVPISTFAKIRDQLSHSTKWHYEKKTKFFMQGYQNFSIEEIMDLLIEDMFALLSNLEKCLFTVQKRQLVHLIGHDEDILECDNLQECLSLISALGKNVENVILCEYKIKLWQLREREEKYHDVDHKYQGVYHFFNGICSSTLPENDAKCFNQNASVDESNEDMMVARNFTEIVSFCGEHLDKEVVRKIKDILENQRKLHSCKLLLLDSITKNETEFKGQLSTLLMLLANDGNYASNLKAKIEKLKFDGKSTKTTIQREVKDPYSETVKCFRSATTVEMIWSGIDAFLTKYCAMVQDQYQSLKRQFYCTQLNDLINQFIQNRLNICDILIGKNSIKESGLGKKDREIAVKIYNQNPLVRLAVEFLLLQLTDALRHIGELISYPHFEDVLCRIKSLEGRSLLYDNFFVRNYLAHGDFALESITHHSLMANSILENSLDIIDKGAMVLSIAENHHQCQGHACELNLNSSLKHVLSEIKVQPYAKEFEKPQINNPTVVEGGRPELEGVNILQRFGSSMESDCYKDELLDAIRSDDLIKFKQICETLRVPIYSMSVLHFVIFYNAHNIFDWILNNFDEPEIETCFHQSLVNPLHFSVLTNHGLHYAKGLKNYHKIGNEITAFLSPLQLAIGLKKHELVHLFLENDADPNLTPSGTQAPVVIAAEGDDITMLQLLIKYKANLKNRCIHEACSRNNLEIVKLVLSSDEDIINLQVGSLGHYSTPLTAAVHNGHLDIIKYLTEEKNADTTATGYQGYSLLHLAVITGNKQIIQYAMTHFKENGSRGTLSTALHYAAEHSPPEIVQFLITECGINVNITAQQDMTPLHTAVRRNRFDNVMALVNLGADILKVEGTSKNNAVQFAASKSKEMLEYLVNKSKYNCLKDLSLVYTACGRGEGVEMLKFLVEDKSCPLNIAKGAKKIAPLMTACANGRVEIVEWIIERYPGFVDWLDADGWTCLHYACYNGKLEVVKVLLTFFGRQWQYNHTKRVPWASTPKFVCPFRLSLQHGHLGVAQEIKAYLTSNAQISSYPFEDFDEYSIFHQAVELGDEEFLYFVCSEFPSSRMLSLIEIHKGTLGARKLTPIEYAALKGMWPFVKIFIEKFKSFLLQHEVLLENVKIKVKDEALIQENYYMFNYIVQEFYPATLNLNEAISLLQSYPQLPAIKVVLPLIPQVDHDALIKSCFTHAMQVKDVGWELARQIWTTYKNRMEYTTTLIIILDRFTMDSAKQSEMAEEIINNSSSINVCDILKKVSLDSVTPTVLKLLLEKTSHTCLKDKHYECLDFVDALSLPWELLGYLIDKGLTPSPTNAKRQIETILSLNLVGSMIDDEDKTGDKLTRTYFQILIKLFEMFHKIWTHYSSEVESQFKEIIQYHHNTFDTGNKLVNAVYRRDYIEAKRLLDSEEINESKWDKKSPLILACHLSDTCMVKVLLDHCKTDLEDIIRQKDGKEGKTALHHAIKSNSMKIVEILVEEIKKQGISLASITDHLGQTPLHEAASGRIHDLELFGMVALLFIMDPEGAAECLETKDLDGNTPWHIAAIHRHHISYAIFDKQNKDYWPINNLSKEPLDLKKTLYNRHDYGDQLLELAEVVLNNDLNQVKEKVAWINPTSKVSLFDNYSAFQLAVINDHVEIVKFLIQEIKVKVDDDLGHGLLCSVAEYGSIEMFQILMENGARVDFFNNQGGTWRYYRPEILEILAKYLHKYGFSSSLE